MDFNYTRGKPIETSTTEVLFKKDEEQEAYEQLLKLLPDFQFTVHESSVKADEVTVPTIVIEHVIIPRKFIFRLLRGEPICEPIDPNLPVNKIQTIDLP